MASAPGEARAADLSGQGTHVRLSVTALYYPGPRGQRPARVHEAPIAGGEKHPIAEKKLTTSHAGIQLTRKGLYLAGVHPPRGPRRPPDVHEGSREVQGNLDHVFGQPAVRV